MSVLQPAAGCGGILMITALIILSGTISLHSSALEFTLARYSSTAVYPNNSVIDINMIGEGYEGLEQITDGGALECHTDDTTCCRRRDDPHNVTGMGEWYYPDGTVVPSADSNVTAGFYRSRDHMVIRLNRVNRDLQSVGLEGTYRCEIPGAGGVNITRFVTLTAGVRCDDLSNIANGSITYTPPRSILGSALPEGERYIGTIATYSCSLGNDLFGLSVRVCGADANWNGTEPFCVATASVSDVLVSNEECCTDGEPCSFEFLFNGTGILVWSGDGFDCPNEMSTTNNNKISFNIGMDTQFKMTSFCGPYSANITRCTDGKIVSILSFIANYITNGERVVCDFTGKRRNYRIEVGVIPAPPRLHPIGPVIFIRDILNPFGSPSHTYNWFPPEEQVSGGIRGYDLVYIGDDCGDCTPQGPIAMVNNSTLSATCTNWRAMDQTCSLEVRTVTEDCGFKSVPVNITARLDATAPTDVTVEVICSRSANMPCINVEWKYIRVERDDEFIANVTGFIVTISDDSSHNYSSPEQLDLTTRSYYFNSTLLVTETNLTGSNRVVTVTVETEGGSQSNTSAMFSVEGITTNLTPALTEDQCIEVSINSFCNESASSFQAQLQFLNDTCDNNGIVSSTTDNYTLTESYMYCIPVEAKTVCYSAKVFRDEDQVGSTQPEELVLRKCNTASIKAMNESGTLTLNSSVGVLSLNGQVVPHNTIVSIMCTTPECTLYGVNQTRCVNGTFEPQVNSTTSCNCTPHQDLSLLGLLVIVPVLVIIIIIAACLVWLVKLWKRRCAGKNIPPGAQVSGLQLREMEHNKNLEESPVQELAIPMKPPAVS